MTFADQTEPTLFQIRSLSDRELLVYCRGNNRRAWQEFFRRYTTIIRRSITKCFYEYGFQEYVYDADIIEDIYSNIVNQLLLPQALDRCENPDHPDWWLVAVARSRTVDWLRSKKTRKGRFSTAIEFADSMSGDPTNDEITADLPSAEISDEQENSVSGLLGEAFSVINSMLNTTADCKNIPRHQLIAFWVLRVSIMFYEPLSVEEIEKLATFSGKNEKDILRKVADITDILCKKAERLEMERGRIVLAWYESMRMERKQSPRGTILENTKHNEGIEEKRNQRYKRVVLTEKPLRPPSLDIAELVGITENQAVQITKKLTLARNILDDRLGSEKSGKKSKRPTSLRMDEYDEQ